MPRFALGDPVITPRNGPGEIVLIYPHGEHRAPSYGVSVEGSRAAVVYMESELRAAAHLPAGKLVRCADCAHAGTGNWAPNTIRCAAFGRSKAKHSRRECKRFKTKTTEPAPPAAADPLTEDMTAAFKNGTDFFLNHKGE